MIASDLKAFFDKISEYRHKNPDHSLNNFIIGLQGEFVFKGFLDFLNIDYYWSPKGIPQDYDFIVNGLKIEVKTVTYNTNYANGGRADLMVKIDKAKSHYYVLVKEDLKKGFYIAGFVSHEQLIVSEQIKTEKGVSYRVTPDKLTNISLLPLLAGAK